MNFFSTIDINILVCIFLGVVLYLVSTNNSKSNYKNRIYIYMIIISIILLLIEAVSIIIIDKKISNLALFNKIINIISFSIAPALAYLGVLHEEVELKKNKKIIIPFLINIIICMLNLKYDLVFSLSADNEYKRGFLFLIPSMVAIFYFIIFFKTLFKKKKEYRKNNFKILILILSIPLVGLVIQILNSQYVVLWSSAGMALIIFYLFNRENEFKYDNLTGACNRYALEVYASNRLFKNKNITLIYIDVNDFKKINDTYGHHEGDLVLKRLVKVLYYSIDVKDIIVRIGGDEFMIITKLCKEEEVCNLVKQINRNISLSTELNFKEYTVTISCGYKTFDLTKDRNKNIDRLINRVDGLMYAEKKLSKKGRSSN